MGKKGWEEREEGEREEEEEEEEEEEAVVGKEIPENQANPKTRRDQPYQGERSRSSSIGAVICGVGNIQIQVYGVVVYMVIAIIMLMFDYAIT